MLAETKQILKVEMETYKRKFPTAKAAKVLKFLLDWDQRWNLRDDFVDLRKFVQYKVKKFNQYGYCAKHRGGNGPKTRVTTAEMQAKVKKLCINKKSRSIRNTACILHCGQTAVHVMLKKLGAKAYHKRKVQRMTDEHKKGRVKFAIWALKHYGKEVKGRSPWMYLVNSDFSAFIRTHGTVNTKNDIIWSTSRDDAGDLLEHTQEKFSIGEMIFGAVTVKGLIPAQAPVFVSDLLEQWDPKPRSVTGAVYADMIETIIGPEVKAVLPQGALWQDDPATIHRAKVSLETVEKTFPHRVPHDIQGKKMADVWPIENVWAIVKDQVKVADPETKQQLKTAIIRAWKKVHEDKDLCRRLISSIPRRLQAVIRRKGAQVTKDDYAQ